MAVNWGTCWCSLTWKWQNGVRNVHLLIIKWIFGPAMWENVTQSVERKSVNGNPRFPHVFGWPIFALGRKYKISWIHEALAIRLHFVTFTILWSKRIENKPRKLPFRYYWALQISRSGIRKGANGHITVCVYKRWRITESNGRNNYNCANEEKPMRQRSHGRAQRNPTKSLRNQQKNNWRSIYGEFHSFAKWHVRWNFKFPVKCNRKHICNLAFYCLIVK